MTQTKFPWRRPAITAARVYDPGMGEAVANRTINRKIERPNFRIISGVILPRQDNTSLDDQVKAYGKSSNIVIGSYSVDHGDDIHVELTLHVTADIEVEKWEDVARRVAYGSAMLDPRIGAERRTGAKPSPYSMEFDAMHHHLRQASLLMSGRHLQHGDMSQPERNMEVFTNCSTAAASFLSFYLLLNGSGSAMFRAGWLQSFGSRWCGVRSIRLWNMQVCGCCAMFCPTAYGRINPAATTFCPSAI